MKNETARREIESLDYYLQNHTDDYSEESHTAMMMAIKALEQKPTEWQKDHEILKAYSDGANEVLEKIRAEIEQNAYPIVHGVNNHEKGMTLYGILQVIDKYKAESEEE